MMYKFLVATDIDNTLLVTGKDVSPANKRAIEAIRDAGGAFALATGRSFFLIGCYAEDLGLDVPCITSNGGALSDPRIPKEILSFPIDPATVRDIMIFLMEKQVLFAGYSSRGVFFGPDYGRKDAGDNKAFFRDYNSKVPEGKKVRLEDMSRERILNGDLPEFNKILTIAADEETRKILRNRDDISCCASTPLFLDLMAPGTSKGKALLRLAELLEIPKDKTFALGDNENDISMIKAARYGIAVGNATDKTKEAADHVACDCADDGFSRAVFEFILPSLNL